jgi:hypothetical protein
MLLNQGSGRNREARCVRAVNPTAACRHVPKSGYTSIT